jgi:hypothetical protein
MSISGDSTQYQTAVIPEPRHYQRNSWHTCHTADYTLLQPHVPAQTAGWALIKGPNACLQHLRVDKMTKLIYKLPLKSLTKLCIILNDMSAAEMVSYKTCSTDAVSRRSR